jgi:hypothetical protein
MMEIYPNRECSASLAVAVAVAVGTETRRSSSLCTCPRCHHGSCNLKPSIAWWQLACLRMVLGGLVLLRSSRLYQVQSKDGSGSTFKFVIAAAKITQGFRINCYLVSHGGNLLVSEWYLGDWFLFEFSRPLK